MKFHSARQCIHDAFMGDASPADLSDVKVQYTAKGSGAKTVEHCEKGVIQQALAVQKARDPVAWAWNMFAYTPPATSRASERTLVMDWMVHKDRAQGINPLVSGPLMNLIRVAMHDVALEDVTGKRHRRRYIELARVVDQDEEVYKKQWHRHYIRYRGYCQELPQRSLPPIANVVWALIDQQSDDPKEAYQAHMMLRGALRMPV